VPRAFDEPWHAQVLAIADGLIQAGHVSAGEWAEGLGAELRRLAGAGRPDTTETYFLAALAALERLAATGAGIDAATQRRRRDEWASAYRNTPHGQPVVLAAARRARDATTPG